MTDSWIISNYKLQHCNQVELSDNTLFINDGVVLKKLKTKAFYLSGFLMPRFDISEISVESILADHNSEKRIAGNTKGNFILIDFNEDCLRIFNDHIGICKFFWYQSGEQIIVSNSIWSILQEVDTSVNREAVIDHILFNRFTEGKTLWKNIHFSGPATSLSIRSSGFEIRKYWEYTDIANTGEAGDDFSVIAEKFSLITKQYVDHLRPDRISVPMTGGFDCRSIVASLLNQNIKPVTYTYGHANSSDSEYGKLAADKTGLEFNVHYLGDNANEYLSLRDEILNKGNSLASSHRAHRLFGIKQEAQHADLMFLGYLGGEVIRGLWPDDLIISKAIRLLWENVEPESIVDQVFSESYFKAEQGDIAYAANKLQEYKLETLEASYLKVLFEIKAHQHYAQDINLFNNYITAIPFYLDLDYLQMVFGSKHNFLFKKSMTQNKLKKLDSPLFNSKLISLLYPQLAKVQLGKGFTPYDYLHNRWKVYLQKGARHYFKIKADKHTSNYSYGAWYVNMLEEKLAKRSDVLKDLFHPVMPPENDKSYTEKELQHYTRIWDLSDFFELGGRK
ncbi:MAG: hypothetical protein LAT67_14420 [Balneolales bacterium]|nr:hypothetical protein [Balneolales bacterium]